MGRTVVLTAEDLDTAGGGLGGIAIYRQPDGAAGYVARFRALSADGTVMITEEYREDLATALTALVTAGTITSAQRSALRPVLLALYGRATAAKGY